MDNQKQLATFGSGCFWCTEAVFKDVQGVTKVTSGYAGGQKPSPTYEEVCNGTTGHAEVVQVEFDPEVVKFEQLVNIFFLTHDPTTMNRQGNDVGTQYRSVIFYHDEEQKKVAEAVKQQLMEEKVFEKDIVTELTPYENFFPAEDYHQDYYAKNPEAAYCQFVISPKVSKFRKRFAHLLKSQA